MVKRFTCSLRLFEAGRCQHAFDTTGHFDVILQVQGPRSWDDLLDSLTDAFFERIDGAFGEL